MRAGWHYILLTVAIIVALCAGHLGAEEGTGSAGEAAQPAADPTGTAPATEPPPPPPAEKPAPAETKEGKAEGQPAAAPAKPAESFDLKLRKLEERVGTLKAKVQQSKQRLAMLNMNILRGAVGGSKAIIRHRNTLGSDFYLVSVAYYLDGAPIFGKYDLNGDLNNIKELEIYNGFIQPGNHVLSVYMVYRGNSSVFVYVEGIQIKLRFSHTFKAEEGKLTRLDCVGYDKGGVLTRYEERPAVDFRMETVDLEADDAKEMKKQEEAKEGEPPAASAPATPGPAGQDELPPTEEGR